ncbi:MAG: DUF4013 domain-containing protein [Caldilineaceae bacterium SB0661_bin_32]|uniref:DUF4013 domain-containing protein n=1 Tax=Caldilineaceae bacterium SB0661_bin_32 TaxID=2605255 RepID=A0A6B1D484_9CHLR|nr:DUF4013 domain-containing protein [Caldilineaceae bacterium SB0661_bin_32]
MDIGRALTYFSEDERWVEKTAIGTGLLLISSLLLMALVGVLGYFILFGYLVRLLQNVRDDVHPVLPEWDRWGDDLVRGVKLACVVVIWALPIILIFFPAFIISIVIADNTPYDPKYPGGSVASIILSCASCLSFLFAIAFAVMQPGFTIAFARNETIKDGLQVSEVWDWTRDNIGNVAIVAILTVIASMIITTVGSIVGLILCVIGAVVTVPLAQLITYYFQSHLYGQLARVAGEGAAGGSFGAMPVTEPDTGWTAEPVEKPEASAEIVPPTVFEPELQEEPEPPAAPDSKTKPEAPEESEQPEEDVQPDEENQSEEGELPSEPKSQ